MKIISPFKDYYDYLIHQYGEDKSIIYHRNHIVANDTISKECKKVLRSIPYYSKYSSQGEDNLRFRWLCVCGKYYLLVARGYEKTISGYKYSPYHLVTEKDIIDIRSDYSGGFSRNKIDTNYLVGFESPKLIEIHKFLKTPVFTWDGYGFGDYDVIDNQTRYRIPKLADYGIPSVLPPETIYTRLEYFLVNVMKDAPDSKPPVEIIDKYKITGHGFDLKQSFRHRK